MASPKSSTIVWKVRIEPVEGLDTGAIRLTPEVHARLGGDRARIPVVGTADGHPIRTSFSPMGGCHWFPFNRHMREATGKGPGDVVTLRFTRDDAPRTIATPADLRAALKPYPRAAKYFESLSFSHRREYVTHLDAAKRPETRARRLAQAVERIRAQVAERIASGKGVTIARRGAAASTKTAKKSSTTKKRSTRKSTART